MTGTTRIPPFSPAWAGQAVSLEATPGPVRRAMLRRWLAEARQRGAATWLLSCAFEDGGVWAGLATLLQDLVPRIRAQAPHLLAKHSYELCLASPLLWDELAVRAPSLTESATDEEKVRNYPVDRAYRSLHGLIDLLDEWWTISGGGPWVIACDDYDRANPLIHRFFAEWLRRRGRAMGFTLLLASSPGHAETAMGRIPVVQRALTVRRNRFATPPVRMTRDWAARAREIEADIAASPRAREMLLPALIHALEQSGADPARIGRLQVEAMHLYIHRGLYEAAVVYAPAVEAQLARFAQTDPELYDRAVNSLFFGYVPLGQVERAYRIVKEEMIEQTSDPSYLPRIFYLMAMLHARFLPKVDLGEADIYLNRALDLLRAASDDAMAPERRAFLTVFMMNGLAFVRLRQRRPAEAVALCREGIALLDERLRPDQHRLHRSVLEYNIAQVFAQIGPYEEALGHFTATMALDPNYSEYYNERGSVLFKLERLDEAERDFRQAIELSPPYPEVWTNLGQCYRAMDRMADAVAAYSRALDLDPTVGLALAGRADAYAALSDNGAALADYSTALELKPDDPVVLGSRAIVYYERGELASALADLDRAIALAPETADYYQNRAVALADLGRAEEAIADLRSYLRLAPDAEDRMQVEERLAQVEAALPSDGVGAYAAGRGGAAEDALAPVELDGGHLAVGPVVPLDDLVPAGC
jgi:tetratricopeptide (TPR) repeat protein